MWCKFIPNYVGMSKHDRKYAKLAFAEKLGKLPYEVHTREEKMSNFSITANAHFLHMQEIAKYIYPQTVSLDCCEVAPVPPSLNELECKKENTTMYYDDDCECGTPTLPEIRKSNYLKMRLDSVAYDKSHEFNTIFFIDNDDAPVGPDEMLARIAAGKFVIPRDEDADGKPINKFKRYHEREILWRDPAKPADKNGRDAAQEKLDAAKAKTADSIMILPPEQGLAALQAFEAQTFH